MPYEATLLEQYQVTDMPDEALRRQVRSIVSSYNSPWDPLTELIQNAFDAINQRAGQEGPGFGGKILIIVDSDNMTVTIEDNGIGVAPGNRNKMILPGGSLKVQGNTYGHKGLGFTYCAHVADYIDVHTIHQGAPELWRFSGGFDWLVDPTVDTELGKGEDFRSIQDNGTSVRMGFHCGEYEKQIANTAVLDQLFDWAGDAKLLTFVLKTRTAIGQVGWMFGEPSPNIDVQLKFLPSGDEETITCEFFNFLDYPPLSQQNFPRATEYFSKIYNNNLHMNKVHHGIYHVFDEDRDVPGKPLSVGKNQGGVGFKVFLFACGKKNLQEALKQYDSRLAGEFRNLAFSTDVHLSIAGMPCGVPIDSWSNHGHHEQRYFALIDAEMRFGTVLDAGRKTITRHYVDLLVDKTIEMARSPKYFSNVASFQEMSHQLHHSSALPPQRGPMHYIRKWKDYTPLPTSDLLLEKLPDDEIGVYLLFSELVGRGLMPGYKLLYVSGGAVYDAAFCFKLDLSESGNLNTTVPGGRLAVGVGNALVQQHGQGPYSYQHPTTGQNHLVVEFKVDAHNLLMDVQQRRSEKQINDIDMMVCLTHNDQEISRLSGSIMPVTDSARRFSGVTHTLTYGGREIQLICLADVIEQLTEEGLLG